MKGCRDAEFEVMVVGEVRVGVGVGRGGMVIPGRWGWPVSAAGTPVHIALHQAAAVTAPQTITVL